MQVTVNMKKLIIIHWLVEISLLQYVLFFLAFFFNAINYISLFKLSRLDYTLKVLKVH